MNTIGLILNKMSIIGLEKKTGVKIGQKYFSTDREYLGTVVGFDSNYTPHEVLAVFKKRGIKEYRDKVISPDYIRK